MTRVDTRAPSRLAQSPRHSATRGWPIGECRHTGAELAHAAERAQRDRSFALDAVARAR
jgi:hypothetical protein